MSVAKRLFLRLFAIARVLPAGVRSRIARSGLFATPYQLDIGSLAAPNAMVWVRILLWEVRSFVQRIRFARERLSAPRYIAMDFVCQSCGAEGFRICYTNVERYMRHIEELRSICPWLGWADFYLLAETWSTALDKACCTTDNARTLLESYYSSGRHDGSTEDGPTDNGPREWWRSWKDRGPHFHAASSNSRTFQT